MTVATISQTSAAATQASTEGSFNVALDQATRTSNGQTKTQATQASSQTTLDNAFISDFVTLIEPLLLNQLDDMLGDAFTGGSPNT